MVDDTRFLRRSCIAVQASMNAQLGSLLKSPILATVCAFIFSALYALVAFGAKGGRLPNAQLASNVPWYLWGLGGILSATGVGLCYFLIPKMGVGNLMSLVLSGQLLMAMIIGHFGWFDVPQASISMQKVVGIGAMVLGLMLVNRDFAGS
ncbi:DMT family transporter [Pseudoalteromonas sp. T1lg23B]|uniref:DMT family transporter n=1 Tax=Pseudoalteromonas sp. T1lg23B TaxID=2077097 RepID=UPI001F2D8DD4|nr:DMT family transporter [Pseudoalteromonas sp. T1lg23B]